MKELQNLVNQLENKITQFDKVNPAISKASIGWHIDHALLTISGITNALSKSNPENYRWKFNFFKTIIFTVNKIPRGKGKAPDVVDPKGDFDTDILKKHVESTKAKLQLLNTLEANQYFAHPYFGNLKRKQSIQFLKIHTKHHLEIINDILK